MDEESIFAAALGKTSPAERRAFLAEACGGDPELLARVEALLRAHENPDSFLDPPAPGHLSAEDQPTTEDGPGTVIGPYRLVEQIGEGGFGAVYMAEQQQPVRRKVALKVLKPGMDTRRVVARFEAERQALALMDHLNIARVFDGGETAAGRPYFVMELVHGVHITDFCDQNRLSIPERLGLFVSVCQAVQHAHQKGIIHRDLKPSNVLVTLHDGTPVVKVIDFGIAKALDRPLTDKTLFTGFAEMIGTPLYMSPEQAAMSGLDVDTRSDVYSLGVLLYELLTGTTPFDKERLRTVGYDEMRRIIREEDPPRPSTRLSTIGRAADTISANRKCDPRRLSRLLRGELDWVVMKALEKSRDRRYDSAGDFAADVRRYLADEPVLACPPSAWYRIRKLARRHRTALTVAGLVLALGVSGLAIDTARVRAQADQKVQAQTERANMATERVAALEREKAALETAEADFQLARKAVEEFLDRVTDDPELAALGDYHPLRRRLLASALPFYQEWTRRRRGDQWMGVALAETFGRLAFLEAETGDPRQALADYDEARTIYARLVKEAPDNADQQARLADCLMQRGTVLRQLRRREEALAAQQDALAILQGLIDRHRADPRYRAALAANHANLGAALAELNRPGEALTAFEQAVSFYEGLAHDFPDNTTYRRNLGKSLNNEGYHLYRMERCADSLTALDRALGVCKKLVEEHPNDPRYLDDMARDHNNRGLTLRCLKRREESLTALKEGVKIEEQLVLRYPSAVTYAVTLGGGYCNIANRTRDAGRPGDALDWYARAVRTLEPLAAGDDRAPNARLFLRNAHSGRAQALNALDRNAEAARDWARAAELDDGPKRTEFRLERAICLALAGDHARAVAEAVALAEGDFGPDTYHDLAAVCSLAAGTVGTDSPLKERYAAQAVALLKKAVAKGFKDGRDLKGDPAFAALRTRKDFQELLRKLEVGAKP